MSIGIIKSCKNHEDSYGVICVRCNKCKRFNFIAKCLNCGKKEKMAYILSAGWGRIQLYDGWFNICPQCSKFFTKEQLAKHLQEVIPCHKKDFKKRNEISKDTL